MSKYNKKKHLKIYIKHLENSLRLSQQISADLLKKINANKDTTNE